MADIFISYRRDDARADAGRLHDRLCHKFGHQRVFMDVDDVRPGVDFVALLQSTLASCGVVVVVIGKDWLGHDERTGQSRLDNPNDFVHVEVRTALARAIPVLPVLVGGASMPLREQLPDALAPLVKHQALELRHTRFDDDVDRLVDALSTLVRSRHPGVTRRFAVGAIAVLLSAAAGYAAWRVLASADAVQLRSEPAMVSIDAAKAMLARLGFYDARWNTAGQVRGDAFEQTVIGEHVVVVDHATGLMWQKTAGAGSLPHVRTRESLERLNAAAYAGFTDWRMPTLEEAMSLMRVDKTGSYHMAAQFDAGSAPFIWTADSSGPQSGWVVYFFDGLCSVEKVDFNAHVRAVRTID